MAETTLADEIITIIQAHSNNNPAPTTCTITKVYNDNYVDIQTSNGKIRYLECIGITRVGSNGIVIYKDGNINDPRVISVGEYYTRTEISNLLADKQDKLVSGTNIKTINNQTLLGSGNITIQGGGGGGTINMVGAFTINDNGDLIVELPDGYVNPYFIDDNGNLIYDTSTVAEEEE